MKIIPPFYEEMLSELWKELCIVQVFQRKTLGKRQHLEFSSETQKIPQYCYVFHGAQACLSGRLVQCRANYRSEASKEVIFYGEDGEGCEDV